jgi:hypothetical protein
MSVSYQNTTWHHNPKDLDVNRFKVLENRMLRSIYGHKREEVVGGW